MQTTAKLSKAGFIDRNNAFDYYGHTIQEITECKKRCALRTGVIVNYYGGEETTETGSVIRGWE